MRRGSVRVTAAATREIAFRKYQGLGNDFILVRSSGEKEREEARRCPAGRLLARALIAACVGAASLQVDNRSSSEPIVTPDQAAKLCDRNFGIGGDGVSFPRCAHCPSTPRCARCSSPS